MNVVEGQARSILIVGGGTAGWLTAAYLARFLGPATRITVLEDPAIGAIGVGEGRSRRCARPCVSWGSTRRISSARRVRPSSRASVSTTGGTPRTGQAPPLCPSIRAALPGGWRRPRRALAGAGPGDPCALCRGGDDPAPRRRRRAGTETGGEGAFDGPLSYAYHFDAHRLVALLADHAMGLGVRHLEGRLTGAQVGADGLIAHVVTDRQGMLTADLYVDCTGQRAELISGALGSLCCRCATSCSPIAHSPVVCPMMRSADTPCRP
ncbi:hypothetical protein GCM10020258_35080 [Sphingomonas yabuuchiae]